MANSFLMPVKTYSTNSSSTTLVPESYSPVNIISDRDFNRSETSLENFEAEDPALPPTDGGRAAWTFVAAAVLIDAVIWAFPLSFGVFQNYYASHPPFEGSNYIALIGTFATGIAYLGGPLMTPITIKFHAYRQYTVALGAACCVAANLGASFTKNMLVLVLCQGVLYGVGFLIISYCVFSMINEWFIEKRGLAYGVLLSGAGISGLGLPFLLEMLLARFGYAITLRIYALATALTVGPVILLLRPRPCHVDSQKKSKIDYSSMKKPIFTNLSICNFLQGLVFYLPGIFLPSYATGLSLSSTQSSILLAVLNLTSVLGTLTFGYLSDFVDIHILLAVSSLSSSIAVLVLWGMGSNMLFLSLFSICYGFMAGSFEALFPRFATAMTDDPDAELTFYGFFEFERGLGMVLAGPIASVLLGESLHIGAYGMGMYMGIVLFVGSTLFVGSLSGLAWFFKIRPWYR